MLQKEARSFLKILWMTSKEKGIYILRNLYTRRILRQELLVIEGFLNISILYH